ncbi:MAG: hypothetical protein Q9174_001740 [Haloplaca sp. 1 TL-2023]
MLSRHLRWQNKRFVSHKLRALSLSRKLGTEELVSSRQLPTFPARTRFAPSPTGYLHLGSLRTALFNYLIAKATGGQFLLRVEDTDTKRTISDAEARLYSDLKWAGLQWDEGPDIGGTHGPYKQSQRTRLYREHADTLLHSGHAYRCFCSPQALNELARQRASLGQSSDYDRACEGIPKGQSDERASAGEGFVVRLRVPQEPPEYRDLVYGLVGKPKHDKKARNAGEAIYEDPILLKSDGLPTYHLANVVDDHHMQITHVVRAAEWMSSTPKHLILYKAFGWEPPAFAHVGLLQDSQRQKFSKRKAELDLRNLEEEGYFPQALINYVALYGWQHNKTKSDVLSMEELVATFDMKFTKGNTVVEHHKLAYFQKKYAAKYIEQGGPEFEAIVDRTFKAINQEFESPSWYQATKQYPQPLRGTKLRNRVADVLRLTAPNYISPKAFFDNHQYFFYEKPLSYLNPSKSQHAMYAAYLTLEPQLPEINRVLLSPTRPEDWTSEALHRRIERVAHSLVNKLDNPGKGIAALDPKTLYNALQSYLRLAIARGGSGPPMDVTMALLGRDVCVQRLEQTTELLTAQRLALQENEQQSV